MRRKYIMFFIVFIVIIGSIGCSQESIEVEHETETILDEEASEPEEEASEEMEEASEETETSKEEILIGVIDYPPFEYVEDGELTGPGVEIVREAFNRMGYEYKMELYPWARLLKDTGAGKVDVMLDVYYTDERAKTLIYSQEPYGIFPQTFVKRKGKDFSYQTLDDVSDVSIGIIRDYHYGEEFHKKIDDGTLSVDYADDIDKNFQKLLKERIDVIAETYYSAKGYIEKNNLEEELEIVENSFDQLISYVCFSKVNGLEDLRDEYDQTIQDMREDGTLQEIYDKYNVKLN